MKRRQQGQAMTELTVSLVALVPVFLLIPLMGKYIDIRHSAVQAARYEAWEHTVWYANSSDLPSGYNRSQPVKGVSSTKKEARRRFLSKTGLAFSNNDMSAGWQESDKNPLWTDHHGNALYEGGDEDGTSLSGPLDTPDITGGVISDIIGIIDIFFDGMSWLMNLIGAGGGNAGFTAINEEGYFKTRIALPVKTVKSLGPSDGSQKDELEFQARAAVLADGWNSGGKQYTQDQVEGMLLTSLLNNPVMNAFQDIASYVLASPELNSDSLIWGYVDTEGVHPDRLEPMDGEPTGHTCYSSPLTKKNKIGASGLCAFSE